MELNDLAVQIAHVETKLDTICQLMRDHLAWMKKLDERTILLLGFRQKVYGVVAALGGFGLVLGIIAAVRAYG